MRQQFNNGIKVRTEVIDDTVTIYNQMTGQSITYTGQRLMFIPYRANQPNIILFDINMDGLLDYSIIVNV